MRRAVHHTLSLRPLLPLSTATRLSRTLATENLPIQERIRRKLWGSDAPPGPQDPYTGGPPAPPVKVDRSNYVEATDARGLPIVAVKEMFARWEVDSFAPLERTVKETEDIHRAVHRAVVETYTVALNDRDPTAMAVGDDITGSVRIEVAEDGAATFTFPPGIEAEILRNLEPREEFKETKAETDEVVEASTSQPQWLQDSLASSGWIKLPLSSPEQTFAISKRILQLTGLKVPDVAASLAKTVEDLLIPLITPEKPAKLAEELVETELAELPNVKLYASRVRPLDAERMIGRARRVEEVVDYTYEGIDRPPKTFRGHVVYQ